MVGLGGRHHDGCGVGRGVGHHQAVGRGVGHRWGPSELLLSDPDPEPECECQGSHGSYGSVDITAIHCNGSNSEGPESKPGSEVGRRFFRLRSSFFCFLSSSELRICRCEPIWSEFQVISSSPFSDRTSVGTLSGIEWVLAVEYTQRI